MRNTLRDMLLVKHRERYELTYPDLPQNMDEDLAATAAEFPGKTAIVDDFGQKMTFGELREKTVAFAETLSRELGVGRGARVGILLYNSLE